MRQNNRSLVASVRNIALLFLAFAVFSWGLQAKLELYKAPSSQRTELVKLSTEKHSAKVLKAFELKGMDRVPSPVETLAIVFLLLLAASLLESVVHKAEIALASPSRFYLRGTYSLNRPPPTLL
jgi:hypothetical protein